ncbi:1416_t:CDS:2 [Paraglomus occultum]|uniref:1416_t:CDS:1 n=1 Tax=Paraglomus occultum TaxID=144539 RepID=A0A9N9CMB4_9GLOM|nr:1416_t:CDS:2 [Paraglomus occultum]
MEERIETVSISAVNTTQFQRFCDHVNTSLVSLPYNGHIPKHDIDFYHWNADAAEINHQQRKDINIYLNRHLKPKLPEGVIIFDVSSKRDLLNITKNPLFPFNVRGGTNLILVEKAAVETGLIQAGIRAIIVLKKNVQDNHSKQAIFEMLIADLCVSDEIRVIGVLTDLVNTWNFYWIEKERTIKSMHLSHRGKALDLIGQLASTTQKRESKNPTIGRNIVYREKVKYAFPVKNDYDNDIARIEDLYDDMSMEEIREYEMRKIISSIIQGNPIFSDLFDNSSQINCLL